MDQSELPDGTSGQRQSQTALRESEERYRGLVELSPDLIAIHQEGAIVYMNPAGARLLGADSPAELIGQPIMDRVAPACRAEVIDRVEAMLAQGAGVPPIEEIFVRLDGSTVEVEVSAVPVTYRGEAAVQVIARDVTERKRSHEALLERKALLKAIAHIQSLFIEEMDRRVLFHEMLETARLVTGSDTGFLGEVLHDADGAPYIRVWATSSIAWSVAAQQLYEERADAGLEFRNLRTLFGTAIRTGESVISNSPAADPRCGGLPEGHPELRSFVAVPLHRGAQLLGLLGLANRPAGYDEHLLEFLQPLVATCARIIEAHRGEQARRQAEHELQAAKAHLQAVFDASPLAILAFDTKQRVIHWNRAAEQLFGWSAAEVLGMPAPVIPPSSRPQFEKIWKRLLDGETFSGLDVQRLRRDGSLVEVSVSTAPLRDAVGQIRGSVAVIEDATERLKLEQELRQVQKMEAVGQLAGGVAHDFNNALTPIAAYTEMLLDCLPPHDPLRTYAEQIAAAAEHAARLPRQLLAFSRKQIQQPRVIALNDTVGDMVKLLRSVLGERIEIVPRLPSTLAAVKADPGQIEQVLMNLAVNAHDAMPDGGVLTIETTNADLDEAYCRLHPNVAPGRYVMLAVCDTGSGMDAETQARIFEPFFTTKDEGKGTGLGLSTVYGIVVQSGGHIQVESSPGQGSTFRIYLPAVSEAAAAPSPAEAAAPRGSGEVVLVVEDEDAVRRGVAAMLQAYGYTVLTADGGEEGLRLAQEYDGVIDLLLTDVVMAGIRGETLAQRLLALHPDLRVVYMSGYAESTVVREDVPGSGVEFLQKPFTPSILARKLREVLNGARS